MSPISLKRIIAERDTTPTLIRPLAESLAVAMEALQWYANSREHPHVAIGTLRTIRGRGVGE